MRVSPQREKYVHWLYLIGVWFKGIDGTLEIIGGVLFLLASRAALNRLVAHLTQHELVEDPTDWVATHVRQAVHHLSSNTKVFASAYLLAHGAVKVGLVWGGLLRRKLWAFPTAMVFLGAFIGYQTYRVVHHVSLGLAALTVIDFIVLLLIWHEYHLVRRAAESQSQENRVNSASF